MRRRFSPDEHERVATEIADYYAELDGLARADYHEVRRTVLRIFRQVQHFEDEGIHFRYRKWISEHCQETIDV